MKATFACENACPKNGYSYHDCYDCRILLVGLTQLFDKRAFFTSENQYMKPTFDK